jgi:hypothetical protein
MARAYRPPARRATVGPRCSTSEFWRSRRCSCRYGKRGNLADFLQAFAERGHTYEDDCRGAQSQYWVTIEDGVVVAIDEQYVP